MGTWVLVESCCHPANASKYNRGLQGPCIEKKPCVDYIQDR
jgi:hypothetical protein